ncbi:uncharacterized protein LOC123905453 isoform X4 [Trifolium pratense]|uniref:uncharacterized protein LOC123905453 isoform X4 n=1 Tax=Trifolium pratense TaxID=57577 RepID=UPI001E692E8C|nr:uncharacterized protein LOC123905453 isoform X4 [Trifolium pratense]
MDNPFNRTYEKPCGESRMKIRSVFDGVELRTEFQKIGIDSKFVPIIWKHLFLTLRSSNDWDDDDEWEKHIPFLPSSAYSFLRSNFKTPLSSTLHSVFHSSDNLTSKLLIKLQNGSFVEAVIMRYDTRLGKYAGKPRPGGLRATLCISSQVGCKMGCKFCATGSMGFKSNLSSGEIVEQLVHASTFAQIRNVVFMGMGEPLNNYSAVVESIRIMTGSPFQLSLKRITVSTVGIIHAINKLHNDVPGLNLAVSLHAPAQDIRCQIMPAARAFPLEKLMDSLQEYKRKSLQKILIEYIMLDGVNDEEQHAHLLGKLLETFEVQVVNLIPFNSIGTLSQFKSTSEQKVSNFQKILRGTYNIRTKVRKQMGEDISGACGQLGDLCRYVIANDEFENSGSESENSENSEPESENSEPESENSSETLSENENFAEIICDTYFAPNKAKDTHLVQTDFLDVILTLLWFASPSDERPNHSFQRMLRCLRYLPVDYLADEAMDQLTEEDLDLILVSISGIEDSTIELKANAMKFYQRAKLRVKQQDPYYPNAHDPSLMTEMLEKIICRLDDYYSHQKEKRKVEVEVERPGQLKASGMKEIDFKKQAEVETIDTRTCDQAVPKAYTEMDDDESGYTTHHSYSGSSDVGKTIDEEGQTHNIAGILFFRQARSCLSYEQYSAFLATIKKFVAKKQTRELSLYTSDILEDMSIMLQNLLLLKNENVYPTEENLKAIWKGSDTTFSETLRLGQLFGKVCKGRGLQQRKTVYRLSLHPLWYCVDPSIGNVQNLSKALLQGLSFALLNNEKLIKEIEKSTSEYSCAACLRDHCIFLKDYTIGDCLVLRRLLVEDLKWLELYYDLSLVHFINKATIQSYVFDHQVF